MKKLEIHIGNVAMFLKLGYGIGDGGGYISREGESRGYGNGYSGNGYGYHVNIYGEGYGSGNGYYKYIGRQLVGDGDEKNNLHDSLRTEWQGL